MIRFQTEEINFENILVFKFSLNEICFFKLIDDCLVIFQAVILKNEVLIKICNSWNIFMDVIDQSFYNF